MNEMSEERAELERQREALRNDPRMHPPLLPEGYKGRKRFSAGPPMKSTENRLVRIARWLTGSP